jgi:hypothetical protein
MLELAAENRLAGELVEDGAAVLGDARIGGRAGEDAEEKGAADGGFMAADADAEAARSSPSARWTEPEGRDRWPARRDRRRRPRRRRMRATGGARGDRGGRWALGGGGQGRRGRQRWRRERRGRWSERGRGSQLRVDSEWRREFPRRGRKPVNQRHARVTEARRMMSMETSVESAKAALHRRRDDRSTDGCPCQRRDGRSAQRHLAGRWLVRRRPSRTASQHPRRPRAALRQTYTHLKLLAKVGRAHWNEHKICSACPARSGLRLCSPLDPQGPGRPRAVTL